MGKEEIELGWDGFELSPKREIIGIRKMQNLGEALTAGERKARFKEQ